MCDEVRLKQNTEKAYRDTESSNAMQAGIIGKGYRVPVRERFYKQLAEGQMKQEQATRVLDIFNRHPEFEEFVELLELLNVKY